MKKILMLTFILICSILLLCGCSKLNKSSNDTNDSSKETVNYSDLLPNAKNIFKNGKLEITDPDGGTAYIFNVTNYTEEEYELYVRECKEKGFEKIKYELPTMFGAYSSNEEYWVQLTIDTESNILYIICQKSKK